MPAWRRRTVFACSGHPAWAGTVSRGATRWQYGAHDMEELTLEIESLAYGIFGVARTERGVVFVPDTAPGDVVRARIVDDKRDYREAELLEVLEPSAVRRPAPCPYV